MLNGCLGFAMLLALLFVQPDDIQSTLNSETYYPFMNIFAFATRSDAGATALVGYATLSLHCGQTTDLILGFITDLRRDIRRDSHGCNIISHDLGLCS